MKKILLILCCLLSFIFPCTANASGISAEYSIEAQTVVISGKATQANKKVTLMLVEKDADLDNLTPSQIGYMAQTETSNDGNYKFAFRFKNNVEDYKTVINQDGTNISDTVIYNVSVSNSYNLDVESNIENDTLMLNVGIINSFMSENKNCILLAAVYDKDGNMQNVRLTEPMNINTYSKTNAEISIPLQTNAYRIKIFMFDNINTIIPMSKSKENLCGAIDSYYFLYPGYRDKAVTLSYDDGSKYDEKLIGILNKYGMKATFNICDDGNHDMGYKKEWYAGHEIASHSYKHPRMYVESETSKEVCLDAISRGKILCDEIFGEGVCNGFVWPYRRPDNRSDFPELIAEVKKYYKYCRPISTNDNLDFPEDWYNWEPTCHHNDVNKYLLKFLENDDSETPKLKLLYVWGHSLDFENGNNWDLIENFSKAMSERNDVWKATNIEVYNYKNALDSLKITDNSIYNPSDVDVYAIINGEQVIIRAGETIGGKHSKW